VLDHQLAGVRRCQLLHVIKIWDSHQHAPVVLDTFL